MIEKLDIKLLIYGHILEKRWQEYTKDKKQSLLQVVLEKLDQLHVKD